jgi:hypothetical protein
MPLRQLKPNDPIPQRVRRGEGFVNKLPCYREVLDKVKAGLPLNTVMTFSDEERKIAGGLPASKIAEKVTERLKKRLARCYRKGQVAGYNYELYQANGEVVVRQLTDDNASGFAHSQRGKKQIPATGTAAEVKAGKKSKKGGVN